MDDNKREAVHIQQVNNFKESIQVIEKLVVKGFNSEETIEKVNELIKKIRASYNNREMALAVTKLQEATHWMTEENLGLSKGKLIEARYWAGEYANVLIG